MSLYSYMMDELLKIAAFTGFTPLPPAADVGGVTLPPPSRAPSMNAYNRGVVPQQSPLISEIGEAPTMRPGSFAQQAGVAPTLRAPAQPSIQAAKRPMPHTKLAPPAPPSGVARAPKVPKPPKLPGVFGRAMKGVAKVI